jgi:hypothetical protein
MRAKIKTGIQEIKATESKACQEKIEVGTETNQEKMEAVTEHCNWTPRVKATHVPTALQGCASNVLHGASKGPTFMKRQRTRLECSNSIRE